METLRGQLLIASPALVDPNFHRAVVLITEHAEEGAMGVVLNRPSPTFVEEAVPELAALAGGDAPVFVGGPVQTEALIVLAEFRDRSAAALIVVADVGLVSADMETESLAAATRRARVFAGYAGWGPGQLEREIRENVWLTCDIDESLIFDEDYAEKWGRALAKLGVSAATLSSQSGSA
jgi:putative transcriptional regulator